MSKCQEKEQLQNLLIESDVMTADQMIEMIQFHGNTLEATENALYIRTGFTSLQELKSEEVEQLKVKSLENKERNLIDLTINLLNNLYIKSYGDEYDYESVDSFYAFLGYDLEASNLLLLLDIQSTSALQEALKEIN